MILVDAHHIPESCLNDQANQGGWKPLTVQQIFLTLKMLHVSACCIDVKISSIMLRDLTEKCMWTFCVSTAQFDLLSMSAAFCAKTKSDRYGQTYAADIELPCSTSFHYARL